MGLPAAPTEAESAGKADDPVRDTVRAEAESEPLDGDEHGRREETADPAPEAVPSALAAAGGDPAGSRGVRRWFRRRRVPEAPAPEPVPLPRHVRRIEPSNSSDPQSASENDGDRAT